MNRKKEKNIMVYFVREMSFKMYKLQESTFAL